MTKIIGRKFSIGIGKETTRGTAVAADFWLPKTELTHDDKIDVVVDESSIGVIENAQGQDVVQKFSEGQIKGRITDTAFGLWLLASLGSEASPATVQTGVYDHVFSVLESAQHPSLTVAVSEANASTGIRFALSMVDSLEITLELGKYGMYAVNFRGNKNASGANTASFTSENYFLPQHAVVKIASALSGLDAASAISIKKLVFTISKNIEDDNILGSVTATDRLNKQFSVEGSIELMYEDRSYIDTIMLGDLAKALRVSFINTDVTIGASSNPTITFNFAKVKLTEVARSMGNDELIRQTLNFKAYYSLSDTSLLTATLRNVRSTVY